MPDSETSVPGRIVEPWYAILTVVTVAVGIFSVWYRNAPKLPAKAPRLIREHFPLLGAMKFWNARWDHHNQGSAGSSSGHFTYYVGQMPVIGLSGSQARKLYFDHKKLDLAEG